MAQYYVNVHGAKEEATDPCLKFPGGWRAMLAILMMLGDTADADFLVSCPYVGQERIQSVSQPTRLLCKSLVWLDRLTLSRSVSQRLVSAVFCWVLALSR